MSDAKIIADRMRNTYKFTGDRWFQLAAEEIERTIAKSESDAKVIAALREALEPFATIGTVWLFDGTADDYAVAGNAGGVVTAAAFKIASRAIEQTAGEN
jgi:hypothetical protein